MEGAGASPGRVSAVKKKSGGDELPLFLWAWVHCECCWRRSGLVEVDEFGEAFEHLAEGTEDLLRLLDEVEVGVGELDVGGVLLHGVDDAFQGQVGR